MRLYKRMETKIIRVRYEVHLSIHGSVEYLRKALADIPEKAVLIDEDSQDGNTVLIFQIEDVTQ